MVGRNVLDGLRKGKKDLYALNVQYVRRYCLLLLAVGWESGVMLERLSRKAHNY